MKKLLAICFLIVVTHASFAQTTGIRFNTILSDTRRVQGALGAGLYLNVNDFSKKIALSFSLDYYHNIRLFEEANIESYFAQVVFNFNPNYILKKSGSFSIYAGPVIGFIKSGAHDEELYGLFSGYNANYIGCGFSIDFQYYPFPKIPACADFFISPAYLFNVKSEGELYSDYGNSDSDLKQLNFQVGIAFDMK